MDLMPDHQALNLDLAACWLYYLGASVSLSVKWVDARIMIPSKVVLKVELAHVWCLLH